jgi:sugar lactone lactonase YvrE
MSPARRSARSISTLRPTPRRERSDRFGPARWIAAALAIAALCLTAPALAHPGSGIGIDRQGRIFFIDTGEGVWVVEADGRLRTHDGPAFHWMALDPASAFGATNFTHLPSSDMRAVGRDPMVLLSSDFPIAVGTDGALYFPEPGTDRRLHLVRLPPGGERSDLAVLPAESDGSPLQWLNGVAAGPDGSIYYSENASVRRIDPGGAITTVASGIVVPDCDALRDVPANFTPYLRGLAVAADGAVYVAANGCRAVVRIGPDGAATIVLRAEAPYSPTAVALGGGDLYVLEYVHTDRDPEVDRKVWVPRVRKLASDGTVSLVVAIDRGAKPAR